MALIAGEAGVFALEQVAGFLVIEFIGIPFNEREVHAVVVGVAAHALLAGAGGYVIGGVQSALGGDARTDVRVATDTAELGLSAAEFVAVGAVGGAFERLMLASQRTGRDLRWSGRNKKNKNEEKENYTGAREVDETVGRTRGDTPRLLASNLSMWQRIPPLASRAYHGSSK